MARPEVAIAHDYLTQRGGAERVVLAMLEAFPDAVVHTALYDADGTYPEFRDARIVTSVLDRVGPLRRRHRLALPLLAPAASRLTVDADVTVVSSSGWAHGFDIRGRSLVYCYSPARWLYQSEDYLGTPLFGSVSGAALAALRSPLRRWDKRAAHRADRYLAISRVVQDRIRTTYGLESEVVPAPHSMDATLGADPVPELADWADGGYVLVVSRLLPYKNVDKVVDALASSHRLVVVGRGPEEQALRARLGASARLLSGLTDAQMRWLYAHCSLLVAPSIEDFGLTPLEAATFGRPTVALRGGGYLDTIEEGVTGAFFEASTPARIRAAVDDALGRVWDADDLRRQAARFTNAPFVSRLRSEVAELAQDRGSDHRTQNLD
jgi:glycosyltransferase involved in cell wall biosynthesis